MDPWQHQVYLLVFIVSIPSNFKFIGDHRFSANLYITKYYTEYESPFLQFDEFISITLMQTSISNYPHCYSCQCDFMSYNSNQALSIDQKLINHKLIFLLFSFLPISCDPNITEKIERPKKEISKKLFLSTLTPWMWVFEHNKPKQWSKKKQSKNLVDS